MRQGWWFGASLGLLGILLMLYWTAKPEQSLGMDPPLTTEKKRKKSKKKK